MYTYSSKPFLRKKDKKKKINCNKNEYFREFECYLIIHNLTACIRNKQILILNPVYLN